MAIEFRCTKCNKLLQTGNDAAGKQVKCPQCGTVLPVPDLQAGAPDDTQPYDPRSSSDEPGSRLTESCPFCAEPISAYAIKCKHCGSMLTADYGKAPPGAGRRITAAVCAILLGSLGIHKFILGLTTPGLIMLLVSILTCGAGAAVTGLIGLIEGIIYLTKSNEEFYQRYIVEKTGWF